MDPRENSDNRKQKENNQQQTKPCGRREFLKGAAKLAALGGTAMLAGCGTEALGSSEELKLRFQEFIKKNYRLMTPEEKDETVQRLERLAKMKRGVDVQMSPREPIEGVLFGYAFNVTRCEGYMECVSACVKENNLDRKSNTQYIRIFEMEHGKMSPEVGDGKFFHEVPVADHFYGSSVFSLPGCTLHQSLSRQGHLDGTGRHRRRGLRLVHWLPILYRRLPLLRTPVQLERTGGSERRNDQKAALSGQPHARTGTDGKMYLLCAKEQSRQAARLC